MNANDFRDNMLAFLFLRYLTHNYEAAAKKELGQRVPQLGRARTQNDDMLSTLAHAWVLGINLRSFLDHNDAHSFFQALGDSVVTGPTLTNVNDFRAILIDVA
jgi:hypothetical protein